jgi:hypothetical protein
MNTLMTICLTAAFVCCVHTSCVAQKNLIDVPSGEIVEKAKSFFQQQLNINNKSVNASTIFSYGLGHNFEIGLNVNQLYFERGEGVQIDSSEPEENPDFLVNLQKGFSVSDKYDVSIGTRSGIAAFKNGDESEFATFNYLNNSITFLSDHKFIVGGYYTNDQYAGKGNKAGVMAGLDIIIKKDAIDFLADFTSGKNALSVINLGFEFQVLKSWTLTFGYQFPVSGSNNEAAGLIQISRE